MQSLPLVPVQLPLSAGLPGASGSIGGRGKGPASGSDSEADPACGIEVNAWLDSLRLMATFPTTLLTMADTLSSLAIPSGGVCSYSFRTLRMGFHLVPTHNLYIALAAAGPTVGAFPNSKRRGGGH